MYISEDVLIYCAAAIAIVVLIDLVWHYLKARRFKDAKRILIQAKQEAQEIAQLPLHNPHPQMQISDAGRLVFANPAAITLFPGIDSQGFDHFVFNGIQDISSREISANNKTYHQTIEKTRVNGDLAYVVYCYDITDRKWFENEIKGAHSRAERMRKDAEHAKEARGEFLANMSHELRTPMNGIIGLSDMLVDMGLGPEKQDLIEAVNSSARNLLILLNDILDFSKIEAGELSIENIPFDIRKAVKQIESLQKPMARHKGLQMQSVIDDSVPRILIGDPSRLQQILNNLISNALKFTERGSVKLSVYGQETGTGLFALNIAVIDTGIGIAKDKQAAVFKKFQQADTSTARKYGGTGLGLAITKDLAELMNGNITIDSEEGVGTSFIVTVKLAISDVQDISGAGDDSVSNNVINTHARVMIVDDNPINLLFLRRTLSKMGFSNFDEATSGFQALEYFANQSYDLIVMDCQMPDMDGFETAKQIRAQESKDNATIIIAATADAMKGAKEKCLAAGMDDYISKPIDKDKFQHMLYTWIPLTDTTVSTVPAPSQRSSVDVEMSSIPLQVNANGLADASSHGNDNGVIDWDHLNEFTDGDATTEKEIIAIFISNLKADMSSLHSSLQAQNYTEWDGWVHKIYGSSSHMGAYALAKVCDEGQSLSADDVEKIHVTHKLILEEYKRIQTYFAARKRA